MTTSTVQGMQNAANIGQALRADPAVRIRKIANGYLVGTDFFDQSIRYVATIEEAMPVIAEILA